MSEVCAIDTESPWSFLSEEVALGQLTAALIALRLASAYELENKDVVVWHEAIVAAPKASGQRDVFLPLPLPCPVRPSLHPHAAFGGIAVDPAGEEGADGA